ncbi:uroporphyrinogen decarboxylase [candidate division KSB1 bacterium]|nr:uroporphyrinogen decarboxylase [candidate division KSB1 bacterium]
MGKKLLLDAIKGKETERLPWVPFVGCHGGALIDEDAESYLKSGELMTRGTLKAIEEYDPDGIPVNFDLSIEAEALGCELQWAKENPPAVTSHILSEKKLQDLPKITENSGRIPEVIKVLKALKEKDPDVGIYALVTGPFTLALHLQGTDIFMDMYDKPDEVKNLLQYCNDICIAVADIYLKHGCDVVSLVDPMTSQIGPDAFREFITPSATAFFDHIRSKEALSSFFVCGDAQKNVEAMCETGPDNISVDENISLDYVRDICQQYDISFGGNLKLTVVLLMGTEDDVRRHTIETMDMGGNKGFILAPGCDLPYNVPTGNLKIVTQIVQDSYQQDVARELAQKVQNVQSTINLTEYGRSDKVIVDVITLDSESCAPCQYMVEAVKNAAPHFGDLVVWREHTIKERESVEFMMGLMVKNIPTICIDGKIKFVSTIPRREELIKAIQDRINEKFALKLREQKGKLLVLGSGSEECEKTWQNAQQALRELGSTVEIKQIQDEKQIEEYGVASTPAVVTISEEVKYSGRVPSVEVIKEWIKALE